MSGVRVDELTTAIGNAVENAVYTAVGLGILGFQHVQVQRRRLRRQVASTARQVVDQVERAVIKPR
jgi:uncharacterized protein HemX